MKSPAKYGFAGFAAVVLASLPVALLSTAAHAQSSERVQVATSPAAFAAHVDQAARHFCRTERNLTLKAACQSGIRQEAAEKASSSVQMASASK